MELFIMFWGFIILYNIKINKEEKEDRLVAKAYLISATISFILYLMYLIKGA